MALSPMFRGRSMLQRSADAWDCRKPSLPRVSASSWTLCKTGNRGGADPMVRHGPFFVLSNGSPTLCNERLRDRKIWMSD